MKKLVAYPVPARQTHVGHQVIEGLAYALPISIALWAVVIALVHIAI